MAYVQFIQDTFDHRPPNPPDLINSLKPKYIAGHLYELSDEDIHYYVARGLARVAIVKEPKFNKYKNVKIEDVILMLGLQPRNPESNPVDLLRQISDSYDRDNGEELENRRLANETRLFFGNKELEVSDIADLLVMTLEYATSLNDRELIAATAGQLLFMQKITGYLYARRSQ